MARPRGKGPSAAHWIAVVGLSLAFLFAGSVGLYRAATSDDGEARIVDRPICEDNPTTEPGQAATRSCEAVVRFREEEATVDVPSGSGVGDLVPIRFDPDSGDIVGGGSVGSSRAIGLLCIGIAALVAGVGIVQRRRPASRRALP